jgi:hypothetical protein
MKSGVMLWMTAGLLAGLLAGLAFGQAAKLMPVRAWPRVLNLDGKQIVNPDAGLCVRAGYRLIPEKPATPGGKRIVSERFEQDDERREYVRWVIEYEDIPPYVPPPVVGVVTAASDRVRFVFETNGAFRAAVGLDAPRTNGAQK